MDSEYRALDRVERAVDQSPHCSCGLPVIPVAHDDGIWLECTALRPAAGSRVRRILTRLVAPEHVRQPLVDWVSEAA